MDDNQLSHFGVKGMKWGKSSKTSGSKKGSTSLLKVAQRGIAKKEAVNKARQLERVKSLVAKNEKKRLADQDAKITEKLAKGEKVTAVLLSGPSGLVAVRYEYD